MSLAASFVAGDKAYASIADGSQTGLDPGTSDFSVSIAFYATANSSGLFQKGCGSDIAPNNTGYRLYINSTGKLSAGFCDGSAARLLADSSVTVGLNAWHIACMTADRDGNLVVYLDGVLVISLSIASQQGDCNSVNALFVGNVSGLYFSGYISHPRFATRLLTATEIARQCNVVLGTEAVTNGDFTVDRAGWTAGSDSTLTVVAGGYSGNCLQITKNTQGYAYQSVNSTIVGCTYRLTLYHKNGSVAGNLRVGTTAAGFDNYNGASWSDANWTSHTVEFTATATTTYITLLVVGGTSGDTTLWDSVSLKSLSLFARPYAQLTAAERVGLQLCLDDSPATAIDATHQWADLGGSANHLSFAATAIYSDGFETFTGTRDDGVTDAFSGWTVYSPTGGIADATATAYSGANAVKLVNTTARPHVYRTITGLTGGRSYQATFATRGDGTKDGNYAIYDVTNGAFIVPVASTGVTGTSYQVVTADVTLPANCTSIQLYLYGPTTAGTAYFDAVTFTATSIPSVAGPNMISNIRTLGGRMAHRWYGPGVPTIAAVITR